jgi:hemerythrin-like metal-binding protein
MPTTVSLYTWKPEYATGVAEIDAEHRTLFEMASELHQAMLDGHGPAVLGVSVDRLLRYTREHLEHEEQLMRGSGFAGLAEHVAEHDRLREKAVAMVQRFRDGERTMTIELAQFVAAWLKGHTTTMDRAIAAHLRSR